MTRPVWFNVRFLASLPFAVLADLLGFVDTKLANAVNEGWCDYCGCWNGHAHPTCEGDQ